MLAARGPHPIADGKSGPRRIDGLGGADPLTSKICIIGPGAAHDADVDYTFGQGLVVYERLRTAQHCGQFYGAKFIGGHEVMDIAMTYDGPDPKAYVEVGGRTPAAMERDDNKGSS
jgi:PrpF protein